MKAIVIYEPGGPDKLIYQDVPTPQVKEGWSLVKVKGFGINHSEIFTREGKSPSVQFPRILGIECVGEVAESSTPALQAGQKVVSIMGEMGRAFDGSYAEYVLLPNAQIYPIESDRDWATLAAIPETYYTAFGSLQQLHIAPDDRVLVRAAASGVGVAFALLLKARLPHITLHGACRKLEKADRLRAVGFDAVIADSNGVLQTDESYDKILELVGPPPYATAWRISMKAVSFAKRGNSATSGTSTTSTPSSNSSTTATSPPSIPRWCRASGWLPYSATSTRTTCPFPSNAATPSNRCPTRTASCKARAASAKSWW